MSFSKASDLLKLAMRAASYQGVSLAEIEEEFNCSPSTARRMAHALASTFPATDHYIHEDGRARWRIPAKAIAALLTPTAEELAALQFATDELDLAGSPSEARFLRQLYQKVRALISPERGTRLAVDEDALLEAMGHATRPGPRPASNPAVDAALSEALKGLCRLRILYRSRHEQHARTRIVEPYGLLLGVRRYLVAIDTKKRKTGLHHYRVEDIESAEVMSTGFTPPEDFNLQDYARKSFGSFQNDSDFGEVIWRFRPEATSHARRYLFHPTQTAIEEADGSLTVRFRASGLLEMCWHLYAWGNSVEVLQPAALAGMVEGHQRNDFPALP